jgi:hypothetical protein
MKQTVAPAPIMDEKEANKGTDKKDQTASTRVDPNGRWGDFFEASLLDIIKGKRHLNKNQVALAPIREESERNKGAEDFKNAS